MEDSPELVKLLRYILFGYVFLHLVPSSHPHPLLTEPPSGSGGGPSNGGSHPYDEFTSSRSRFRSPPDLISSFAENRGDSSPYHVHGSTKSYHATNFKRQNELDHEEMRTMMMIRPESTSGPQRILEKFGGSLCSIFKTFIEPRRRSHRCHVGSGPPYVNYGSRGQNRDRSIPPLHSNDLNLESDMMTMNHQHEMEMRIMMAMMMGSGGGGGGSMQQQQHQGRMGMGTIGPPTGKRYDAPYHNHRHGHSHLDAEQINNSGEELDSHHPEEGIEGGHDGEDRGDGEENPMIDPTKISQDRTMILVPERSCPPGQRRDASGYCRRLVKIRTNYQYGPPPLRASSSQQSSNSVVRPIPIRYYYSRIVTIPAFQFYYPNVNV